MWQVWALGRAAPQERGEAAEMQTRKEGRMQEEVEEEVVEGPGAGSRLGNWMDRQMRGRLGAGGAAAAWGLVTNTARMRMSTR